MRTRQGQIGHSGLHVRRAAPANQTIAATHCGAILIENGVAWAIKRDRIYPAEVFAPQTLGPTLRRGVFCARE